MARGHISLHILPAGISVKVPLRGLAEMTFLKSPINGEQEGKKFSVSELCLPVIDV